jgi:hypothetical protein
MVDELNSVTCVLLDVLVRDPHVRHLELNAQLSGLNIAEWIPNTAVLTAQ